MIYLYLSEWPPEGREIDRDQSGTEWDNMMLDYFNVRSDAFKTRVFSPDCRLDDNFLFQACNSVRQLAPNSLFLTKISTEKSSRHSWEEQGRLICSMH